MNAATRSLRRIAAIAAKEALHIRRDTWSLNIALGMPVLLLLLFGYGVSFDVSRVPLLAVDHDASAASRDLIRRFTASGDFRLIRSLQPGEDPETWFRRGAAVIAVEIPAGYARALGRGDVVDIDLRLDGGDPSTTGLVLAMAESLGRSVNLRLVDPSGQGFTAPLDVAVWTRFNPEGRSAIFLVPGLVAYILALVSVMLTALTIARERENGSMEQLFATPVRRLEIILGKLLPYLALGVLQVLLVLALGAWLFSVPLRGSVGVLALSSLLFMIGMLGQGLLVSVMTRSQMVATQAATLSSMLPSLLLSGFLFPVDNMPWVLRWISAVVPARYFIEILRGVLLKGTGWAQNGLNLVMLLGFATLMIAVATLRFDRKIA